MHASRTNRQATRLALFALVWGVCLALVGNCPVVADDWMTWASTYTHEPVQGQRIDQYALPEAPLAPYRADFQRSGYRHFRSTLQAGQSADNMHIVEQWGRPVLPYEQWRFPYRPYAVPYDAWGPQAPYGILNGSFYPPAYGGIGYGGIGYGGGGYGGGGYGAGGPAPSTPPGTPPAMPPGYGAPRGFPLQPSYQNQPWYDGTYPSAPPLDPRSDQEFFWRPSR